MLLAKPVKVSNHRSSNWEHSLAQVEPSLLSSILLKMCSHMKLLIDYLQQEVQSMKKQRYYQRFVTTVTCSEDNYSLGHHHCWKDLLNLYH